MFTFIWKFLMSILDAIAEFWSVVTFHSVIGAVLVPLAVVAIIVTVIKMTDNAEW